MRATLTFNGLNKNKNRFLEILNLLEIVFEEYKLSFPLNKLA